MAIDPRSKSGAERPGNRIMLTNTRVLVVEDEALLMMTLTDMLEELGCRLSGSAASVKSGLDMARDLDVDVAVLDVNLRGERIDPVADMLAARGIPFVFTTGYSQPSTPARHAAAPVVSKPYNLAALRAGLERAIARPTG
jgi:CheY-like chemotaxis protein